jgi:hypothetical protein
MSELKTKFDELEKRIQKLISLHKQLKSENLKLVQLNKSFESELKVEKQRYLRLSEGLADLKEEEKTYTNKSISGIKQKVNEMISEIDRSVTLINAQHKK